MKCAACGFETDVFEMRGAYCRQCSKHEDDKKRYKQQLSVIVPEAHPTRETQEPDASRIVLTTSHQVSGREAATEFGIVAAEVGYGLNILKDIANSWRDTFGGRSNTVQNSLKDAREEALAQLKRDAFALGADAVISTRIEYNQISTSGGTGGSILFVAAYGTAVKLSPLSGRSSDAVAAIAN